MWMRAAIVLLVIVGVGCDRGKKSAPSASGAIDAKAIEENKAARLPPAAAVGTYERALANAEQNG